ncbi:hypothetical protein PspLS_06804 [Pyricularia sp. CBS 133598]|nr:hypothetical protein PspLS_06804 [Pyricularia sp. CBS 133598]
MVFHISRKSRIIIAISISVLFFVAELYVAFRTRSLALMADAFHYLSEQKKTPPEMLSFGWQRATILGSFFNGVFLLALGLSIFLQSIERFISLEHMEDPFLVLIMGCVGLGLNIISIIFLHEHHDHADGHTHSHSHSHSHGEQHEHADESVKIDPRHVMDAYSSHAEHRHHHQAPLAKGHAHDLGMAGVLLHVVGDAINNLGVILAAVIIWKTSSEARFYADPAISTFIAIMIFITAVPLVRKSGEILLQSVPVGLSPSDVTHDLEKIPGVDSIHHLHIWRLDQTKTVASVHVVVKDEAISDFMTKARTVTECLHAYGVHTAIIQPEVALHQGPALPAVISDEDQASIGVSTLVPGSSSSSASSPPSSNAGQGSTRCQMACSSLCEDLRCCT